MERGAKKKKKKKKERSLISQMRRLTTGKGLWGIGFTVTRLSSAFCSPRRAGFIEQSRRARIACVEINATTDLRGGQTGETAHFPPWNWCASPHRDESRKYCKSRRCDLRTTTSRRLINRRTVINEGTPTPKTGKRRDFIVENMFEQLQKHYVNIYVGKIMKLNPVCYIINSLSII